MKNVFALSTHFAPNWLQYEICPIVWTFTYKTQVWGRFIFLQWRKSYIYDDIHTWLTVTTDGHQKEAEVTEELLLFYIIISNPKCPSITHWLYFCDIFSSYIFKMRISNSICVPWYKSTQFFFISRFLRSKYAPQHVQYSSLVCRLLFCFCYRSMLKLSEALHGLVFNFSKECYNADTLLCVSYWASFTAENYCYDKNHIL